MKTSARRRLVDWLHEGWDEMPEYSLKDVTGEAVSALRSDPHWLAQFVEEQLTMWVFEIVHTTLAKNLRRGRFVLGGDLVTSKQAIEKKAAEQVKRSTTPFGRWMEAVGSKQIRLMEMTREDLLVAADNREGRGQHEIKLAALWRTIAAGLEGGQAVKERYTEEEIEAMQRGIENA